MAREKKKEYVVGLADRLGYIMKVKGLSQAKLAEMLGLHKSTITGYFSGKMEPTALVLKKLHELLGVSIDWFLTGKGEPFASGGETKKFLIGKRLKEIMQSLGVSTQELFSELKGVSSEKDFLRILDDELEVAEGVVYEIEEALGLEKRYLLAGADRKFRVVKENLLEPKSQSSIQKLFDSGKYFLKHVYTCECSNDKDSLFFAFHFQHKHYRLGGYVLYDPMNYTFWNWIENPQTISSFKHNLLQMLSYNKETGSSTSYVDILRVISKEQMRLLISGEIHPQKIKEFQVFLWFIDYLTGSQNISFKEAEGKTDYCLRKFLYEVSHLQR